MNSLPLELEEMILDYKNQLDIVDNMKPTLELIQCLRIEVDTCYGYYRKCWKIPYKKDWGYYYKNLLKHRY